MYDMLPVYLCKIWCIYYAEEVRSKIVVHVILYSHVIMILCMW